MATALVSATVATLMCYPLDTVRRQMQMKGSPYMTILDAFPGNVVHLWETRMHEDRMTTMFSIIIMGLILNEFMMF